MFFQQQAECEQHQAGEILLQTAPIMRQLLTLMQDSSLPRDWMTREPCCAQNCLQLLCEKRTDLVSEIHMELSPLAAAVRQHIHHCSVPVPCKSVQRHGTFGQRENPHSKKKRKLVDRSLQSQQARTEAFEQLQSQQACRVNRLAESTELAESTGVPRTSIRSWQTIEEANRV